MIHQISRRAADIILLAVNAVGIIDELQLVQFPAQGDEIGIKGGDKFAQQLDCIAFRVYGDEYKTNLVGLFTQLSLDLLEIVERGRANIGAARVAKEKQHDLSVLLTQLKGCAAIGLERKIAGRSRRINQRALKGIGLLEDECTDGYQ